MKKFLFLSLLGFCLASSALSLRAQPVKSGKDRGVETILVPEMYLSNNILYIKNAQPGAKLQIITIVGNKVREIELQNRDGAYELNLPKAIYIFKLQGIVRKFIIN
jgi:hypothetical protein